MISAPSPSIRQHNATTQMPLATFASTSYMLYLPYAATVHPQEFGHNSCARAAFGHTLTFRTALLAVPPPPCRATDLRHPWKEPMHRGNPRPTVQGANVKRPAAFWPRSWDFIGD